MTPIRIALGNQEFEGKNNAYLLAADGETTLVDTGFPGPAIRDQLEAGLSDYGYGFAEVDRILLTHHHRDHAGLAGAIQAAGGARVLVHERDAALVRRDPEAAADRESLHERRFAEWGMPTADREELAAFLSGAPDPEPPSSVEPIDDGDAVTVGDLELTVHHAPGHAAGHCVYEFASDGRLEAFVGDVVLPVYTPNVGGADLRLDRSLQRYLDTLATLAARDYDRFWPGHRSPIGEPTARIREIVDHHRERTRNVVDVLDREGPATAWEVSASLFGDLEGIHVLHGPGEAFAHLDHLVREGFATRRDGDVGTEADRYALRSEAEAVDEPLDSEVG